MVKPTKRSRPAHRPEATAQANDTAREPISLREIQWHSVDVPSMALAASEGSSTSRTVPAEKVSKKGKKASAKARRVDDEDADPEEQLGDWDPFADLDEGADDFMGLQEVSGVGVSFQGDEKTGRTTSFYKKAAPITQLKQPAKRQAAETVAPKSEKKRKTDQDQARTASGAKKSEKPKSSMNLVQENVSTGDGVENSSAHDSDDAQDDDDDLPEGIFAAFDNEAEGADDSSASHPSQRADVVFDDGHLPDWPRKILERLHPLLKNAVKRLGFKKPTPVQSHALPLAMPPLDSTSAASGTRDVVALAQTGSGKTLAYALPILQRVLASQSSIYSEEEDEPAPLQALIVLPTRELALQVYEVFQQLVRASTEQDGETSSSVPPWVRVAPVVGGMSEERQWRLLRGRKSASRDAGGTQHDAAIVIATVGRLWELCKSDDYLPKRLKGVETLILDEADRLLETGKFQELSSILDLLHSDTRQTMMFSATLDAALQVNLTKSRAKVARMFKQAQGGQDKMMLKLVERVGFKDPQGPELVNLTKEAKVSEGLIEGKMECLEKEKDLYLYYILLRYPGCFLVFLNSIDSVRRLQPLLTNLGVRSFPLHGEMDQRSRLRSLDGFKKCIADSDGSVSKGKANVKGKGKGVSNAAPATRTSVLLATDVAARGLDIPSVPYVVHFHLPRAADTYIHRSGRTARAGQSGLSLVLLSPGEKSRWNTLRRNLGRGDDGDLQDLPVMVSVLGRLKTRLRLSRELDEARHRMRKEKADDDWVKKLADEAEIALDEDDAIHPDDGGTSAGGGRGKKGGSNAHNAERSAKLRSLEAQLANELSQDLVVRGLKRKFITQGAGLGVGGGSGGLDDDKAQLLRGLVQGTGHDTFLGLAKTTAVEDLRGGVDATKKKNKAAQSTSEKPSKKSRQS